MPVTVPSGARQWEQQRFSQQPRTLPDPSLPRSTSLDEWPPRWLDEISSSSTISSTSGGGSGGDSGDSGDGISRRHEASQAGPLPHVLEAEAAQKAREEEARRAAAEDAAAQEAQRQRAQLDAQREAEARAAAERSVREGREEAIAARIAAEADATEYERKAQVSCRS